MSYAAGLVPALQGLAAELSAAGVPTTLDRARLQLPGAWLRPDRVAPLALDDTARARVSVFLVRAVGGDAEVLDGLAELLDRALTVLEPDEDVDTAVLVAVGDNLVPGFRLTLDIDF